MMSKIIISCAITGSIHTPSMSDALPITPDQIAEQAIAAAEAGKAEQEDAAVDEALLSGITAVENSPVSKEELVKDYLTAEERWELLIRWRKEMNREPEPAPAANGQSESTPPAT